MIMGRLLNKIINIFTGIFGIVTLILMLIICINNAFGGFIPAATAYKIGSARNYFTLATVFCAGIEFTLKRNIVAAAVFSIVVVAVACFMIYSDVISG